MVLEAVIFDVGGVLRDSREALHHCYKTAFDAAGLGLSLSTVDTWHLRGIGKYNKARSFFKCLLAVSRSGVDPKGLLRGSGDEIEARIDRIVSGHVSENDNNLLENITHVYKELWSSKDIRDMVHIYPDVIKSLEELKKKYRLGVFSNANKKTLERDLAEIEHFFDIVLTDEEIGESKPSPRGILDVCRMLGVAPDSAVYVGDSIVDVRAAKKAGCLSIAVLTGMGTREILEKEGPDYIFENLTEMRKNVL